MPPTCRTYRSEFVDCLLDAGYHVRTVWACAPDLPSADRAARDAGFRCSRWLEVPVGLALRMDPGDVAWQVRGGPVLRSELAVVLAAERAA